jgi:hypothetical protein
MPASLNALQGTTPEKKPFDAIIGGVKVRIRPHPGKGTLPLERLREAMKTIAAEKHVSRKSQYSKV